MKTAFRELLKSAVSTRTRCLHLGTKLAWRNPKPTVCRDFSVAVSTSKALHVISQSSVNTFIFKKSAFSEMFMKPSSSVQCSSNLASICAKIPLGPTLEFHSHFTCVKTRVLESNNVCADTEQGPYSKFRVGAAFLTADNAIITGANMENASSPVGVCAERCALPRALVSLSLPDQAQELGKRLAR